jgi:hypothetical protein
MASEGSINESSATNRSILLKRFSGLHEYLCLLGEHVNQIGSNLDRIEHALTELQNQYHSTSESTKTNLQQINDVSVTKTEVLNMLQDLNNIITGAYPQLRPIQKANNES